MTDFKALRDRAEQWFKNDPNYSDEFVGNAFRKEAETILAALDLADKAQEPINLCEAPEAAAMRYIDILRSDLAASVTILTDNEEADTLGTQCAIEVQAEWASEDWEPVRFYGETVLQALARAVIARKQALQGDDHGQG